MTNLKDGVGQEKAEICPKCHFRFRSGGQCFCTDTGAPHFIADFHDDYFDVGLGKMIHSRQERKRVMKEIGVEEIGNDRAFVDPAQVEHRCEVREQKSEKAFNQKATKLLYDIEARGSFPSCFPEFN